jgi:foldase protein PrsA
MKKKPTRKKQTQFKESNIEPMTSSTSYPYEQPSIYPTVPPRKLISPMQVVGIAVLVIALVVLFAAKNGWIVAAVVNGMPIFRWDLTTVLTNRYGQQTLDSMVTEKLITAEAEKANVSVSQTDIDARAKEILSSFGSNLTIDDFLRLQGMKRSDFDNQIKLQIEVQRLLTKGLSISDNDIEGYIASNHATLVATDPAKLKEEARQAILDQKVSEQFDSWLQALRQKSSVQKFL